MAAGGDFDDMDENDADENAMILFNLFVVSQGKFVANFLPGTGAALNFAWARATPEFYDDRLSISPVVSIGEQAIAGSIRRGVQPGRQCDGQGRAERHRCNFWPAH